MQVIWSPGVSLEQIEKQVILAAYEFYKRNIYLTSKSLNVEIGSLQKKINKYEKERLAEEEKIEIRKKREEEFISRARGPNSIPV
jgi:hypothetical protein